LINSSLGNIEAKRDDAYFKVIETAKPDLIIDGSIVQVSSGVVLQMRLTDPVTREVRHTCSVKCESQASLQEAVRALARETLGYLDNKVFHKETDMSLKPWTTTKNMTALSSFIQATRLMYNFDPEAERYLVSAIESDPEFVSARIWLVSMLMKRGDTAGAKRQMDTLRRFETTSNPFELTMIRWADAFIRDDTLAQIRNLTVALEFSPHNNILLFMLARLEYIRQHFQECINALLPAIEMRWPYSPAYYMLAVCYHQLGRNDEAKKVLDISEAIQPTHPGIFMLRMIIAIRDGDTVKAGKYEELYIERMRDPKGNSHAAYCELADICAGEQFYSYALHLYRNAIAEDPANAVYHDKLAWTLGVIGDSLAAGREARRVDELKRIKSARGK
jgi:tetratricopeptide (TPR) repeat protein